MNFIKIICLLFFFIWSHLHSQSARRIAIYYNRKLRSVINVLYKWDMNFSFFIFTSACCFRLYNIKFGKTSTTRKKKEKVARCYRVHKFCSSFCRNMKAYNDCYMLIIFIMFQGYFYVHFVNENDVKLIRKPTFKLQSAPCTIYKYVWTYRNELKSPEHLRGMILFFKLVILKMVKIVICYKIRLYAISWICSIL